MTGVTHPYRSWQTSDLSQFLLDGGKRQVQMFRVVKQRRKAVFDVKGNC